MPKRKHRTGDAQQIWAERQAKRTARVEAARLRVQTISGHALLRPVEAAAMLGVTQKTLREMEARGELPPRVTFSPKIFGWRLADMESVICDRMAAPRKQDSGQ